MPMDLIYDQWQGEDLLPPHLFAALRPYVEALLERDKFWRCGVSLGDLGAIYDKAKCRPPLKGHIQYALVTEQVSKWLPVSANHDSGD